MKKRIIILCILSVVLLMPVAAFWKERILVETDKDLYLTGESILFSLTTADTINRPVEFSKVAYVELLSQDQPEMQLMIDISKSTGSGQLSIPAHLPSGYYRLVAYTRYMRNEGAQYFSRKLIAIVNPMTLSSDHLGTDIFKQDPLETNIKGEISFSPDRQIYPKRSQGSLLIHNLPGSVSMVSVVVVGETSMQIPEDKIEVAEFTQPKPEKPYIAEYEGHIIRGKLIAKETNDISEKEEQSIFLSSPGNAPVIYLGKSDETGNVSFITGNNSLKSEIVTVINTQNAKKQVFEIHSPFAGEPLALMPKLEISSAMTEQILQRSVALQAQKAFQSDTNKLESKPFSSLLMPYKTYLLDEYTRFSTLEEIIIEFISNVRFRKIGSIRKISVTSPELGTYTLGNSLVLLDNIPVFNHELLLQYNPLLLERVDVFVGKYVFGNTFFDGIVSFSTYQQDYKGFKLDESTSIVNYPVLQLPGPFIAPVYSNSDRGSVNIPDLRHTLLWMPNIPTEGRSSFTIPFSTSDYGGTFRIRVLGLTKDGQLIHSTSTIEVK